VSVLPHLRCQHSVLSSTKRNFVRADVPAFTLAFIRVLTIATCHGSCARFALALVFCPKSRDHRLRLRDSKHQLMSRLSTGWLPPRRECGNQHQQELTKYVSHSDHPVLRVSNIVRCPGQPGGHSFVRGDRQHKKAPRNRRSCHQKCKSPGLRQLQSLFRLTRTCIRGRHLQHVQVRLASNI
jgi:hypothetical protein